VPETDERSALDAVVRQELAAQKAVELGLDPGPEYRAELGQIEAQVAAFKRRRLAALYEEQAASSIAISDDEVRKYFEAEGAKLRSEVHVWQIMVRDESVIEQARRHLESGIPFEEAVRRLFPNVPAAAGAFWDLGWLRWSQVPEPWRDVVARLEKGQTSGVIKGPRSRFWIVKLVDRRESPELTFDVVKPMVVEALRAEKVEARRAQAEKDLRSGARIVYAQQAR
jgi:parvulin-like peptidyl-prolyl isomerase